MKCQYCGDKPRKVFGNEIYPYRKSVHKKKYLLCSKCDAYVGCHDIPGYKFKPFGALANRDLRLMRRKAHAAFDPIWKLKHMSRREAYAWLSKMLGIEEERCHVSQLTEEQCARVMVEARAWLSTRS